MQTTTALSISSPSGPAVPARGARRQAQVHARTDLMASILALGVVRWHRRRVARQPQPSQLGPETCHTGSRSDSSAGKEVLVP